MSGGCGGDGDGSKCAGGSSYGVVMRGGGRVTGGPGKARQTVASAELLGPAAAQVWPVLHLVNSTWASEHKLSNVSSSFPPTSQPEVAKQGRAGSQE